MLIHIHFLIPNGESYVASWFQEFNTIHYASIRRANGPLHARNLHHVTAAGLDSLYASVETLHYEAIKTPVRRPRCAYYFHPTQGRWMLMSHSLHKKTKPAQDMWTSQGCWRGLRSKFGIANARQFQEESCMRKLAHRSLITRA